MEGGGLHSGVFAECGKVRNCMHTFVLPKIILDALDLNISGNLWA